MFLRREPYRSVTVTSHKTESSTRPQQQPQASLQISYAVNYQRCVSASGATISPAHAQAHRMSLAGGVSQHGGATRALLSGDPGLGTKPSEFFLGYSQPRSFLHMQHTSSGYGVESAGQRFFCSLERRDRFCGPHNLLCCGERRLFSRVKSA